jgi:hypothetical protein
VPFDDVAEKTANAAPRAGTTRTILATREDRP